MRSNWLQLNVDNTDVVWCASARRLSSLPSALVSIAGSDVLPVFTVRSLVVLVDSEHGAASHVRLAVSWCFTDLRQLGGRLTASTGDMQETCFWFQRLSLTVQHFNAICFQGSFHSNLADFDS
jgi:hypothetical protein